MDTRHEAHLHIREILEVFRLFDEYAGRLTDPGTVSDLGRVVAHEAKSVSGPGKPIIAAPPEADPVPVDAQLMIPRAVALGLRLVTAVLKATEVWEKPTGTRHGSYWGPFATPVEAFAEAGEPAVLGPVRAPSMHSAVLRVGQRIYAQLDAGLTLAIPANHECETCLARAHRRQDPARSYRVGLKEWARATLRPRQLPMGQVALEQLRMPFFNARTTAVESWWVVPVWDHFPAAEDIVRVWGETSGYLPGKVYSPELVDVVRIEFDSLPPVGEPSAEHVELEEQMDELWQFHVEETERHAVALGPDLESLDHAERHYRELRNDQAFERLMLLFSLLPSSTSPGIAPKDLNSTLKGWRGLGPGVVKKSLRRFKGAMVEQPDEGTWRRSRLGDQVLAIYAYLGLR